MKRRAPIVGLHGLLRAVQLDTAAKGHFAQSLPSKSTISNVIGAGFIPPNQAEESGKD